MAADRGAEAVEELVLGQPGDLGKEFVLHPSAGDRRHAQDRGRGLGYGRDVGQQDLAERRREARAGATLAVRGEEFLGEERIAVGSAEDVSHELRLRLRCRGSP